uniref:PBPe domain-containing protein n=1 Tax=Macrostomum lignano TaxID=282301 RepID=A0A1I8HJW1_9PLAT
SGLRCKPKSWRNHGGRNLNSSLIDVAFARRVNYNWRVLQGHTLSYVHVNVSSCSSHQAVRTVCSESGLSGLIGVGSCSLLDEVSSLSKSLQLPLIALPTGLCDSARLSKDMTIVGSHSSANIVAAAASVITSDSVARDVAILYDKQQRNLQSSLSSAGVSSLTFRVDDTVNASVTPDLVHHLKRLVKKKVFKLLLFASPRNALSVLRLAREAAVMQQNYFWLVLDTGLSKADVLSVTPAANANVALLRGSVFTECTAAVMDVFPQCQTDWLRTLDARFVDAVEAMAKALNDSLLDPGFSPGNASCAPLRHWTSGSTVLNRLMSISDYDTQRGLISFNSSTRHFSSQRVEVVASYNELWSSPVSMLRSAQFDASSGALSKQFRYKGVSLAFPNTFMGFKNQTIVVCTPESPPMTNFEKRFSNSTVIINGMTFDLLNILASKLEFRFYTKDSDDGNWGAPVPNQPYFNGCVGELQRGLVTIAAGPFTRTTTRDSVIDYSTPLFQESNGILLPRPPPASKMWNVYLPFNYDVWISVIVLLFICSFITWILAYFSPFTAYNLKEEYAIADEVWFQEYVWSVVGSFLQQGQDFYPFAMSPRTILAFWWMFTVIIYGAYTGDLTAHLTVTITDYPIKTLSDLVSQTAIKPYVPAGTNLYTLFKESNSGVYKQVADVMVDLGPYDYCPDSVVRQERACLNDYTYLLAIAMKNCTQYYLAEETFNTATVAFMYPDDAYFAEYFDFYMQKLLETGLMQRLFKIYWSSDIVCTVGKSTEANSINFKGVEGCFIVTGCLYGVGLILLLLELAWTKLAKKQPLDCVIY